MKKLIYFLLIATILTGCAEKATSGSRGLASTGARANPPSNCFSGGASRPTRLCGEVGYRYLLDSYVRPSCAGCHFTGNSLGLTSLADPDTTTAFQAGRIYSPNTWIARTTANPFINPECNLLTTDGIYADLMAWLVDQQVCN